MDLAKLSRISMKHLITLHVMLDTLSVTASAERLCFSPSSVSKTLSQLRLSLNDELFYRHGNKLVATALARHLGPSVHQIINDMNQIITQEAFNPARYEGRFSLAMRESTFELLAVKLSAHVLSLAPNIRLDICAKDSIGFDGLVKGALDFIILPHDLSQPPIARSELVWETLINDEMICLMNPRHPLAQQSQISIDDYLSYSHIGISDTDLNTPFFEMQLAQQARNRAVPISVADFGCAALMCHHSELLFTCSRRWAETAFQAQGLVTKALPLDYGEVAYSLVWHRQSMNDPALRWLHEQITAFTAVEFGAFE
ncbi:LysR family transcriptional regulator [Shewanella sp. D64]|uniref:LysR family transcriptional regulator n=1 Tax=unclassified Shewanella TaxID=196818 RepID=UPI0022BA461E|nr:MULTISPECIES: LysR family transcriptional regulator [unclassified Shewanella]MEC4728634.1 LysR family transcriptional regulator [Shewanella sp. D64]MEC4740603.1 LysR family transcriptional regulator [Shewanella sp. E94]WBJ95092.1 LysR family transcriptional regulator [Shewanella sp. MTB7]